MKIRKDEEKIRDVLLILICIELFALAFAVSLLYFEMPINQCIFNGIVFTFVTVFLGAFVITVIFKE